MRRRKVRDSGDYAIMSGRRKYGRTTQKYYFKNINYTCFWNLDDGCDIIFDDFM